MREASRQNKNQQLFVDAATVLRAPPAGAERSQLVEAMTSLKVACVDFLATNYHAVCTFGLELEPDQIVSPVDGPFLCAFCDGVLRAGDKKKDYFFLCFSVYICLYFGGCA